MVIRIATKEMDDAISHLKLALNWQALGNWEIATLHALVAKHKLQVAELLTRPYPVL